MEFGLLCQTNGTKYSENPFYDPEKAVDLLRKAYSLQNERTTDYERKSILIPLANTYYTLGRFDDVKSVCTLILRIEHSQLRAHELLKLVEATEGKQDAA